MPLSNVEKELAGYDNIGAIIAGVDEDFDEDGAFASGPEDFEEMTGAIVRLRDPRAFLARTAQLRVSPKFQRAGALPRVVSRLARISRQVLVQTGRIEAEYLRRPNTLVSIYTPALAPNATSAFTVQPGQGNNFYRTLGFTCSDEQADRFGFSALVVGGQNHVTFSQTAPAAPVANSVPWAIYALKESRLVTNLAPWTGQLFDNSTPITGTIVNMTTAAATDAFTGAARIVILTQTDPCSYRSNLMPDAQAGLFRASRRDMGLYAPIMRLRG
jgi:hypothetical protein